MANNIESNNNDVEGEKQVHTVNQYGLITGKQLIEYGHRNPPEPDGITQITVPDQLAKQNNLHPGEVRGRDVD